MLPAPSRRKTRHASGALCALLLAITTLGAAGIGTAEADDPYPVKLTIQPDRPTGTLVYYMENPSGLKGLRSVDWTFDWYDVEGYQIHFILSNGTIWRDRDQLHDGAQWGGGDGIVYAGGPDSKVYSPDFVQDRQKGGFENANASLPMTAVYLIFSWARLEDSLRFDYSFTAGTNVTLLADAPLDVREMRDFEQGVRMGTRPAATAHVGDGISYRPEGSQLFGVVKHLRTDAVSKGAFAVDRLADGLRRELSFDRLPGGCLQYGRWAFTTHSDVDMKLDLIGDARDNQLYVSVSTLPPNTLPDDLWQEWDETPIRCEN